MSPSAQQALEALRDHKGYIGTTTVGMTRILKWTEGDQFYSKRLLPAVYAQLRTGNHIKQVNLKDFDPKEAKNYAIPPKVWVYAKPGEVALMNRQQQQRREREKDRAETTVMKKWNDLAAEIVECGQTVKPRIEKLAAAMDIIRKINNMRDNGEI